MKDPEPPPWQDRMTGVYCRPRCPHCRAAPGPDCADMATRKRRHVENAQLRRYADTAWAGEQAAADAENDIMDCQHGCNGLCVVSGSSRCDFTCHDADTVAYFKRKMTMTVAELIEKLKALPQDWVVCVPENGDANYWSQHPFTSLGYFHPDGRFHAGPEEDGEGDEPYEPTDKDVRAVAIG